MMNHVMVDLETLDVLPTAAFPSIAATIFDRETGEIGETFYRNINLTSLFKAGLTVGAGTLEWWLKQDGQIRSLMFQDTVDLKDALIHFSVWVHDQDLKFFWGNSASFDLGILGNAYRKMGLSQPWRYSCERCYRTIVSDTDSPWLDAPANAHDPRADTVYQIKNLIYKTNYGKK